MSVNTWDRPLFAEANLYRFSSKEGHWASGLVYYLYRYYDPTLQRWVNRDLIEEEGGLNLYSFVRNAPTVFIDWMGLAGLPPIPPGQGISIPPSIPETDQLKRAVKNYNEACSQGPDCNQGPSDADCHTICDAFYGNIAPLLVSKCMNDCTDCKLGTFMKKNPVKAKKKSEEKKKEEDKKK